MKRHKYTQVHITYDDFEIRPINSDFLVPYLSQNVGIGHLPNGLLCLVFVAGKGKWFKCTLCALYIHHLGSIEQNDSTGLISKEVEAKFPP